MPKLSGRNFHHRRLYRNLMSALGKEVHHLEDQEVEAFDWNQEVPPDRFESVKSAFFAQPMTFDPSKWPSNPQQMTVLDILNCFYSPMSGGD